MRERSPQGKVEFDRKRAECYSICKSCFCGLINASQELQNACLEHTTKLDNATKRYLHVTIKFGRIVFQNKAFRDRIAELESNLTESRNQTLQLDIALKEANSSGSE